MKEGKKMKESKAEKPRENGEGVGGYVHSSLNFMTVTSTCTVAGSWSEGINMSSES